MHYYTYTHIKEKEQPEVLKIYGYKWTWETIRHYTETQIKVNEQLLVRKDMDVNEHYREYIVSN